MNGTPLVQLSVVQKNTGTVIFNLEGISFLNKSLPHLSVTELEVAGYPVDIGGGNKENRTRQPITAKARTIIAKRSV
jgi:hypothetical protein